MSSCLRPLATSPRLIGTSAARNFTARQEVAIVLRDVHRFVLLRHIERRTVRVTIRVHRRFGWPPNLRGWWRNLIHWLALQIFSGSFDCGIFRSYGWRGGAHCAHSFGTAHNRRETLEDCNCSTCTSMTRPWSAEILR